MTRRTIPALLLLCGALLSPTRPALAGPAESAVVDLSIATLNEVMAVPARAIPASLLREAQGVAILPGVVKAGFIFGGRFGRGVLMVRNEQGRWGDPVFITITGGSVGWQVGVQSTDVILVFRTRRGIDQLLSGRQFTLGADAAVAAGPVGRQAEAGTDLRLGAEILSYSRSRGLFAGVSLGGSLIEIDWRSIAGFYGSAQLTPAEILAGRVQPTPEKAAELRATLARYAPEPAPPAGQRAAAPVAPGAVQEAPLVEIR
ncbi:MAG: lipid-binding SYLF domain-containing protein [Pirellulales bacterium]